MERATLSTGSLAARIRLFTGPGTRRWPRFNLEDVPSVKGVRSNTGSEMQVRNLSRGGALLRTRKRLTPGNRIQLKLVTSEGEVPLTAFVLRSSISSPAGGPRYHTAVTFEAPLQVLEEHQGPAAHSSDPAFKSASLSAFLSGANEPLPNAVQDVDSAINAAFFAGCVWSTPDAALYDTFRLNNW